MTRTGAALLDRFAWILVLALCLPALVPLARSGWFEGHDDLHIFRLIEYDAALKDGQFPPRWFPDVSAGYGNPHPVYYAPLFYMAAELFHLAGLDPITALKLAIAGFTLLAAFFMFAWSRRCWGVAGAAVAAVVYTYAPYHLLDLYVRKAFSEYTVFAVLPALLLAFHNLRLNPSRGNVLATAIAMAAMSTSHTITTMMVPPLLGAYVLFLGRSGPPSSRATFWPWLGRAALSAGIGYALAAFFLVPAVLERNLVNVQFFVLGYFDFHKHFVFPIQLFWWPWGFGMSGEGLRDGISYRLGLVLLAGIAAALFGLARRRRAWGERARQGVFWLGVTAAALFLALPGSTFVWELVTPMSFIQFPWRFLTMATLSGAFLCGGAFAAFVPDSRFGRSTVWAAALTVCALAILEAVMGGTLRVNRWIPAGRVGFEEKPYINMVDLGEGAPPVTLDSAYVRSHSLHWLDHLPPGVKYLGPDQTDLARPEAEVVQGGAVISDLVSRSASLRFRVQGDTPSRVRVNIYRFAGWTVRIDGAPVPIVTVPRQLPVIFFDVTAGPHHVAVDFDRTLPRKLGDSLTLAGLAAIAAVGLWPAARAQS